MFYIFSSGKFTKIYIFLIIKVKNKLSIGNSDDQYVSYQSDANGFTSFITMCTSLIYAGLFNKRIF